MEFEYIRWDTSIGKQFIPILPIHINGFPVGHALVDTGATISLFPMPFKDYFGIALNMKNPVSAKTANGGTFDAYPSASKLTFSVEHSGFRPIVWEGTGYFATDQEMITLGHHQCLDQLTLTLDGPNKKLKIEKR